MKKRLVIAALLLVLVGGGLIGFNLLRDMFIADFFANMQPDPKPVSTVVAEPSNWQPSIRAIGTVNAAQGVDLTVETSGIVTQILFTSNESVEVGQVLLRLDDGVQLADLEAARTQLELDLTSLERARELQSRGVAANVSLETSQAAARASEAQVARATALLEQRYLAAPFNGTIGLARVDLGQFVSPGTVIATLQDLSSMRIDFTLPEQELGNVSIGQAVHVRVEGGATIFDGAIRGIDPRVDPASRMFALRAEIADPETALTPGQFVRIEIDLPEEDGIIALPQTAVISSLYGDYVYAVREDENDAEKLIVRQVFVQPGRRSGDLVEVRQGIVAGDRVVDRGQNRLSNGMPVTLQQAAAASALETLVGAAQE